MKKRKSMLIYLLITGILMGNSMSVSATEKTESGTSKEEEEQAGKETEAEKEQEEKDKSSGETDAEESQDTQKAREALLKITEEEKVQALIYLCEQYKLRETPEADGSTITSLPTGTTVQIKDVYIDENKKVWYFVSCDFENAGYDGYIEKEYLAYSNEALLQWEEEYVTDHSIEMVRSGISYADVEQFPESYRDALMALKKKHPSWIFVKQTTGLNWETVIQNENSKDRNLISATMGAAYKGDYYGQGWYYASEAAIEYYMDPRNFLDDTGIFQFEQLTFNESYHTDKAVQTILNDTFMKGDFPGEGMTYAQAFYKVGSALGISPFHLSSRVYQEQGKGTSPLISGKYEGYEGYYNYFNVGASGKTEEEVIVSGLKYAKAKDWSSRYASLKGGAAILAANYILKGQDTLYLQKFNVDGRYYSLYTHQYMQNVRAPYTESPKIKTAYEGAGALENAFVFKIPVYKNMPSAACPVPTATATPKATEAPTASPKATATPTQTPKATATPKATEAPTASPKVTATPTEAPKATEAPTVSPKATEAPTKTPTVAATVKPSETPKASETPAKTPVATEAPKATKEPVATPKATIAPTASPTKTKAPETTATPKATETPTASPKVTATPKTTVDPTEMPSASPKATAVSTATPTVTPEATVVPTETPTQSPKATATPATSPKATAVPTQTPKATEAPTKAPTKEPEATETPAATPKETMTPPEIPSPAQTPDATEKPAESATPKVTEKPAEESQAEATPDRTEEEKKEMEEQLVQILPQPTVTATPDSTQIKDSTVKEAENESGKAQTTATPETISEVTPVTTPEITSERTLAENEAIVLDMGSHTKVYAQTLEKIKENKTKLVLTMSEDVSWTIDGSSIESDDLSDIDFGVNVGNSSIPKDKISELVDEEESYVALSLSHEGEFGFDAVLTVALPEASKGQYANLFYYNEAEKKFEFIGASEVTDSKKAAFTFAHASEYIIIVNDATMEQVLEEKEAEKLLLKEQKKADRQAEIARQEEPAKDPVKAIGIIALILFASIAIGVGTFLIYRKKK